MFVFEPRSVSHVYYWLHFDCIRSSRHMGTLVATEEFPHSIALSPKVASAGTVKESVLPNGIKIISRENSKPVSFQLPRYGTSCCLFVYVILSGSQRQILDFSWKQCRNLGGKGCSATFGCNGLCWYREKIRDSSCARFGESRR